MEIEFDPVEREKRLAERGLDFVDAAALFAGNTITVVDDRYDYGEQRRITYGGLATGRWLWFMSSARVYYA